MLKIKFTLKTLPEDVMLELDNFRLQQVIINLLSNAIKFSKAMDTISIVLRIINTS